MILYKKHQKGAKLLLEAAVKPEQVVAVNSALDFGRRYVQSEHYHNLLKKHNYTDQEIQQRRDAILKFNPATDLVHNPSSKHTYVYTGDDNKPKLEYNNDKGDWPSWGDVMAHEVGHFEVSTHGSPLKPTEQLPLLKANKQFQSANLSDKQTKNIINKVPIDKYIKDEDKAHDVFPQENRADLFWLRYQLDTRKIYDSTKGEEFKQEHLDKLRQSNEWNRLFRLYDDKDIIWMMNNIASSKNTSNISNIG